MLSFSLNLGPLALAPMFEFYTEGMGPQSCRCSAVHGRCHPVSGIQRLCWVPIMVLLWTASRGDFFDSHLRLQLYLEGKSHQLRLLHGRIRTSMGSLPGRARP